MVVYEHERWSRKADGQWIPSAAVPDRPERPPHWCTPQGAPHPPPEETAPPPGYGWVTNWRVDTSASASASASASSAAATATATTVALSFDGASSSSMSSGVGEGGSGGPAQPPPSHDRQGWEYATAAGRFGAPERPPRGEQRWSDRARRRRWIRVARARALLGAVTAPAELLRQAQDGLTALARGRRMLEGMMGVVGSRGDSAGVRKEVFQAVDLVRAHAREVAALLQALQERATAAAAAASNGSSRSGSSGSGGNGGGGGGSPSPAALLGGAKKLANDLQRERRQCDEWAREAERRCLAYPLGQQGRGQQAQALAAAPEEDVPAGGVPIVAVAPSSGTAARSSSRSSSAASSPAPEASPLRGLGTSPAVSLSSSSMPWALVSAGRAAFRPSLSYEEDGEGYGYGVGGDGAREAALLRQMRFQDEESVMEAIAVEREEAITEVARQLVELRDVFRDFAQLVAEQQEGIDVVAGNVEDAHVRTKEGYEAVLTAARHQQEGTPACAVM